MSSSQEECDLGNFQHIGDTEKKAILPNENGQIKETIKSVTPKNQRFAIHFDRYEVYETLSILEKINNTVEKIVVILLVMFLVGLILFAWYIVFTHF